MSTAAAGSEVRLSDPLTGWRLPVPASPWPTSHEDAATVLGDDEALASEDRQCLADGALGDLELLREGGLAGELLAWRERAGLDSRAQGIGDLLVDRTIAHGVDADCHRASYTPV